MQSTKSKLIVTLVMASSVFAAMAINGALSAAQERTPPPKAPVEPPLVSVVNAQTVVESASVVAYGEVVSRNTLSLTTQVSGQVTYLSPKFHSGKTFEQGELLAQIEPVDYQQALATAKANLADARLALAQERLSSEQAGQEWHQSGLSAESASDLVLRKPQLAAAEAKYEMSVQALRKAEYDLEQTKIRAPFKAVVKTRQVQLGANVQTGSAVAELIDVDVFEVALPLSSQQWQLLPKAFSEEKQTSTIELIDQTGNKKWTAKVDRTEAHINSETRQRALVVTVEQPLTQSSPLFPGSFVKAELKGQKFNDLWRLPASALIDTDKVWQVTEQGTLAYLTVEPKFSQSNYVYVKAVKALTGVKVVSRPLSSYLENMKVKVQVEDI